MTDLRIRQARESDLERTYELMVIANDDLGRRVGAPIDVTSRSPLERAMAVRRMALESDPERFLIAELDGVIEGFGMATQRDGVWYLAALHVMPDRQGIGIGRAILDHLMPEGSAETFTLTSISEAANPASNGLYGSFGLFPQTPVLKLSGPAGPLRTTPDARQDVGGGAERSPTSLGELDRRVLGVRRAAEHGCWQGIGTMQLVTFGSQGQAVAYAYADSRGTVGPAAAADQETLVSIIDVALRSEAFAEGQTVTLYVPGVARSVLATLLLAGFHYQEGVNLVLTSEPFGQLDRYVMSGADALF